MSHHAIVTLATPLDTGGIKCRGGSTLSTFVRGLAGLGVEDLPAHGDGVLVLALALFTRGHAA